ncbi:MAG: TM2 domain-containing protein [Clostridia bacterium]|nr:TM2 domain-containing protein [Clostridia bacterium]
MMTPPKSKMAAGLLGIFLGGFGVHNFYLGFTSKAVIQIVVSLITCGIGSLWGFIEGIMILTGSINTDASGRPLGE